MSSGILGVLSRKLPLALPELLDEYHVVLCRWYFVLTIRWASCTHECDLSALQNTILVVIVNGCWG
jgi:hypothetical protein